MICDAYALNTPKLMQLYVLGHPRQVNVFIDPEMFTFLNESRVHNIRIDGNETMFLRCFRCLFI